MKKFDINFKLVLISQSISLFGINILRFALLLFILDLTQNAAIFGTVAALSQFTVMFSMIGGIMADRMDKKKLVVAFDAIKALLCFALLFVFLKGLYSVPVLAIFIVVLMLVVTLFQPLLTAATPVIVKKEALVEANGAIHGIGAVSDLLGFVLGGILVATIGVQMIVLLSGIFFVISTVIDLFIKIPFVKQEVTAGFWGIIAGDTKESFLYLKNENKVALKLIVMMAVAGFLFIPIMTVGLPYIVRFGFGASDEMFGIAQAVAMFGMLLGGVLAGKLKPWLTVGHVWKWFLFGGLMCLILALSVYYPLFPGSYLIPFWIFSIGFMLIMVMTIFVNIIVMSLVQEQAPIHLVGKVVALAAMITSLVSPIGQYLYGHITEALGSSIYLMFIGVAILTSIIALATKRVFRKISTEEEEEGTVTVS